MTPDTAIRISDFMDETLRQLQATDARAELALFLSLCTMLWCLCLSWRKKQ